ncbi:MAG: hypothetical protein JNK72_24485 [Myxococcales bacterium]|nr:hypothetical protein [Myxococcales bacterium]
MASRVLLIESDDVLRGAIVRAMRARGVGVDALEASDAIAAVERGAVYERALIDLDLRGTDGVSVAEVLLARLPELEITFAAGGVDAKVLVRAHALGTLVWKPIGFGPLCDRFGMPSRRSSTILKKVELPVEGARDRASNE